MYNVDVVVCGIDGVGHKHTTFAEKFRHVSEVALCPVAYENLVRFKAYALFGVIIAHGFTQKRIPSFGAVSAEGFGTALLVHRLLKSGYRAFGKRQRYVAYSETYNPLFGVCRSVFAYSVRHFGKQIIFFQIEVVFVQFHSSVSPVKLTFASPLI